MNQINGQTFLLALTAISDGGRLHDSVVPADRHRRVQSFGRSNGPADRRIHLSLDYRPQRSQGYTERRK